MRKRIGVTIVYMGAAIIVVCAFASLGIDLGRVQLAKTELQRVADAAARAAADVLGNDTTTNARAAAISIAAANLVDGQSLTLASTDVEFGTWDSSTKTFTVNSSAPDTVRVTARKTSASGSPIPLLFGRVIGQSNCDVASSCIAHVNTGTNYGIVGLTSVSISDKKHDKYKSTQGTYNSGTANRGDVWSNGIITLKSYVYIYGNAHPGIGKSVSMDGTCTVTGTTTPLNYVLSFPAVDASPYATNNNNSQISGYLTNAPDLNLGGTNVVNIPAGTYYIHNISCASTTTLNINGDVTFYVIGNVTLSGGVNTINNSAGNLKIKVDGTGTVKVGGNAALYCDLYCPEAAVTIQGNSDYFGRVIAKSLTVTGSGALHYDCALDPTDGKITSVK